eukprot:IDg4057t1
MLLEGCAGVYAFINIDPHSGAGCIVGAKHEFDSRPSCADFCKRVSELFHNHVSSIPQNMCAEYVCSSILSFEYHSSLLLQYFRTVPHVGPILSA